jgi:pantothenate kinase
MVTLETKSEAQRGYLVFKRARWAALRANTPLSLADADLAALGA